MATAEFEPYSFEPMRNNASSEDEVSEGEQSIEEPRRGNTTCAVVKLGRATRKGMFTFRPGDR